MKEAIPALEELVNEEGDPARGAALRALGRLKAAGSEELLLRFAKDAELSDDLRLDAAEGLAELGTAEALTALRELSSAKGELADLCRDLLAELAQAEAQRAAEIEAAAKKAAGEPDAG